MNQAFYRKYRSKKLDEVVGQSHITSVLKSALKNDKIAHAYLFTGPRGVGKTSIARILAHEINELSYDKEQFHPDIIEIDAASNNGVEDIRSLREQVHVAPISAKKRIYIIDEVHMLSKQAFNALLKTLEEPPEHAVFILATTDTHKIPATIISRTQQFVFKFISANDVCEHLRMIANNEKIKISDEALLIIAERGGGSFRDSISLLDQISGLKNSEEITSETLEKVLGLTPKNILSKLFSAYFAQDAPQIVSIINEIKNSGTNMQLFVEQFLNEIKINISKSPELVELISPLIEAKNSQFLDLELLSLLIKPRKNKIASATISVQTPSIHLSQPMVKQKPAQRKSSEKSNQISKENSEILKKLKTSLKPASFVWNDFLAEIKTENMPAHSIMSQITHEIIDDTISLYAGRQLYKKKLDTAKYRLIISQALEKIGAGSWDIETFAEKKVPENEDAATVFDIMGGGEEVKING